MTLDSQTILLGGCVLLILLAAIFVGAWFRSRRDKWLIWLGVPLLTAAAGSIAFTRPGWDTDALSIIVGNGVRIFAIAAYWQGVRVFEGKRALLWPMLAAVGGWGVLCLWPGITTALVLRVAVTSLVSALFTGLAAYELWLRRDERLASRWPAIAVFASFSIAMILRTIVSPVAPFPMGGAAADPLWLGILMLLIIGHALLAGMLVLAMAMERRMARQAAVQFADAVTGLLTRRAFADFAVRANRRRAGLRSSMALVVVDLDGFRVINQREGRILGDGVLRATARVLESVARPTDPVFRLSGDRFCVALSESSRQQAVAMAESVRSGVHGIPHGLGVADLELTASIGIAETLHPVDMRVILTAADEALRQAKRGGGNRIVIAEAASLFRAQIDDIAGPTRGTA